MWFIVSGPPVDRHVVHCIWTCIIFLFFSPHAYIYWCNHLWNNMLKSLLLQIIMLSEPFLCWSSFYAINEPALGFAHVAILAPDYLFIFYYCRPWQYLIPTPSSALSYQSCPRLSPSSGEASSSVKSLQRDIYRQDLPYLNHLKFCPSSSSASVIPNLAGTEALPWRIRRSKIPSHIYAKHQYR